MKLPNAERAVVPGNKVTRYLLSATHPQGRHKATFFKRHGFSTNSWHELAASLVRHAAEHDVAGVDRSPFGTRYIIEGDLGSPDGRRPTVRSVWFIESGETTPRLVTAYPLERKAPWSES